MQKLQTEIKIYNKIRLTQAPVWINKNKQGKYTTSAVINIKSLKKAQLAMQGLDIAAMRCKIVRYENIKPITQCNKYQKYNHSIIACRNQVLNCRICA